MSALERVEAEVREIRRLVDAEIAESRRKWRPWRRRVDVSWCEEAIRMVRIAELNAATAARNHEVATALAGRGAVDDDTFDAWRATLPPARTEEGTT